MPDFHFAPADEREGIVFGAERPGYPSPDVTREDVHGWATYMRSQGVQRVVCMAGAEFDFGTYGSSFDPEDILLAPVPDFTLPSIATLRSIIAFLDASANATRRTVVHCGAGIGRTAVVLAAWLIHSRNLSVDEAIDAVHESPVLRDVFEAVGSNGVTEEKVRALLFETKQ